MNSKREQAKKEAEKKQRQREKMAESKGDERSDTDDMLASMKAGFDNVSKQIGTNNEENRKEMKDIRESIENLGSMLRQELATFKQEMGNRFEAIETGMEAQARDIADMQERVVETEEWNADLKGILASSLKQQGRLQENR